MLNLYFKLYLTRPISLALPYSPFTLSRFLLLCVPFRALFSIALLTSKLVVLHCTEDHDRYNLAGIVAVVFELNYFVVVEVGLSIGVLVAVSLYQVQVKHIVTTFYIYMYMSKPCIKTCIKTLHANTTSRYVLKSLKLQAERDFRTVVVLEKWLLLLTHQQRLYHQHIEGY
ncbi:hypothetical protein GmHk_11G032913 [Glycine max]|nr:hypothetical protein GmHk_11G032913 [Glycine max]